MLIVFLFLVDNLSLQLLQELSHLYNFIKSTDVRSALL